MKKFCVRWVPGKMGTCLTGHLSTSTKSTTCQLHESIVKTTIDATLFDDVSLSIHGPNLDCLTMKLRSNCMPSMSVSDTNNTTPPVGLISATKHTLYQTTLVIQCVKVFCKISPYLRQVKPSHEINHQSLRHQPTQRQFLYYLTTLPWATNHSPGVNLPDLSSPSCLTMCMKECCSADVTVTLYQMEKSEEISWMNSEGSTWLVVQHLQWNRSLWKLLLCSPSCNYKYPACGQSQKSTLFVLREDLKAGSVEILKNS